MREICIVGLLRWWFLVDLRVLVVKCAMVFRFGAHPWELVRQWIVQRVHWGVCLRIGYLASSLFIAWFWFLFDRCNRSGSTVWTFTGLTQCIFSVTKFWIDLIRLCNEWPNMLWLVCVRSTILEPFLPPTWPTSGRGRRLKAFYLTICRLATRRSKSCALMSQSLIVILRSQRCQR